MGCIYDIKRRTKAMYFIAITFRNKGNHAITEKRPGYRLEAAQLVVVQSYIVKAAGAMDVGKSTLIKCVRQLRLSSKGATLTTITWLTVPTYLTLQNIYDLNHCPGI